MIGSDVGGGGSGTALTCELIAICNGLRFCAMDVGVNAKLSNTLPAINEMGNFAGCDIDRNLLETSADVVDHLHSSGHSVAAL